MAEKQFIHQFHQVFLGFRWIYITICGWHVYSLWPKGLQWRCVTWVGFGSFLFNRSVWSVWSVGSLWSGNQLLTPLGNTFFSSRHFCPRWNMLVVPFLLEAATQVFDTLSVQLKSAPRLPVLQQGECNRQRGGETKNKPSCVVHGSTLGSSLQPGSVIIFSRRYLGCGLLLQDFIGDFPY